MVDFVSEVQEELRKEDYSKWLRKYGPYALAAILLLVLGTAYYEWQKKKAADTRSAFSLPYMEASNLAGADSGKAVEKFIQLSTEAPSGYAAMSLVRAAALDYESGNIDKALANLETAALTFEEPRHAQFVQLKAGYMLLSEGRLEDVKTRIAPLTEKYAPYEFLARELLAITAMEQGNIEEAKMHFDYLNITVDVPPNVQKRAQQNLILIAQNSPAEDLTVIEEDKEETEEAQVTDAAPVEETIDE